MSHWAEAATAWVTAAGEPAVAAQNRLLDEALVMPLSLFVRSLELG
jgi:hypothetical protein